MKKRRNTRVNTLFSEIIFDWLSDEADKQNKSLAQVVRDKVDQSHKDSLVLSKFDYLEKVIKKSHSIIIEKLAGSK